MSAHFGSDPWLDARLRNVPLPAGMLNRLSQISSVSNAALDAALCDVPLPPGLLGRLERIARAPRRHVAWRELALAASVLLAVGIGYLVLVASFLSATYAPVWRGTLIADQTAEGSATDADPTESVVLETLPPRPQDNDSPDSLLPTFAAESLLAGPDLGPLPLPGATRPRPSRPARDSLFAKAIDSASDHLPVLESVAAPLNRGLPTPVVGYDLLGHLKTGERSFVSPSFHPSLVATAVPLGRDTASYRLAERYLQAGRLPPADLVRTEDFLAVLDDVYPPADGPLVLRTAAGPAPFGEPGLRLLQVNVQTGALPRSARVATDLTVAVDTSGSMRYGRRLEMVRQAIRRLASELQPSDRFTLVGFSDQAELLVDHLRVDGSSAAGQLFAAADALQADGATNVGAGIELAAKTIRLTPAEPGRRQRLVLISDGLADLGTEPTAQAAGLIRALALDGAQADLIDVSGDREISASLSELAEAGQGRAVRALEADAILAALGAALAGAPPTVAHSATLKVAFNPQVVHAYRLVGHAAATLTGPAATATQVDLRPGEVAGGLFEVWLKPDGGDDVGTAELSWHDPATASPRQMSQRISRLQFARSFAESPMSLQAAALAAEAARLLRGHVPAGGHNSARLLDLAAQAHPRLLERESFRELLALVEQAEGIRAGRTVNRRTAAGPQP